MRNFVDKIALRTSLLKACLNIPNSLSFSLWCDYWIWWSFSFLQHKNAPINKGKAHTIEALNAIALVDTFVVNDFIVKIHVNASKLDKIIWNFGSHYSA